MSNAILTSGGLALILDYLACGDPGLAPNPPFYFAVGSGTLPVTAYMSRLPGETFRQPIVAIDTDGPSVVYHGYLGISDNQHQTVGCYGVFGGNATLELDTGTLVALANEPVPFGKDATTTLSSDIEVLVSGTIAVLGATNTHAILTSGGVSLIRDYLAAGDPDFAPSPPSYLAVGPGTADIGRFMSQVPNETYRTPITMAEHVGQSTIFRTFIPSNANTSTNMGTYGLLAGDATPTAGTGTLIVLASGVPFTKGTTDALEVDMAITVSGIVGQQ